MREAIHEILTDVSDSFSNMIDMALANEIRVTDLKCQTYFAYVFFFYFYLGNSTASCM